MPENPLWPVTTRCPGVESDARAGGRLSEKFNDTIHVLGDPHREFIQVESLFCPDHFPEPSEGE